MDLADQAVPARDVATDRLWAYYEAASWTVPRFYQSPAEQHVQSPYFRWLVVSGCVVLVKVRKFPRARYAVLPPISLHGDVTDEVSCVELLRANGFGVRLAAQDVVRLGLTDAKPRAGEAEYVYRVDDWADLQGQRWANVRSAVHQAARRGVRVEVAGRYGATGFAVLADRWALQRSKSRINARLAGYLGIWPATQTYRLTLPDGRLGAASATEYVPQGVVLPYRLKDYDACDLYHVPEAMRVLAHHEAVHLADQYGGGTLLNMGIARDAGMVAYKDLLRPTATVQLYDLPPA